MYSRLLVATDFSPAAHVAEGFAHDLATAFGSAVTLAHVRTPGGALDEPSAREALEVLARERFEDVATEVLVVAADDPARTLAELGAARGVDLLVAGRHGTHGIAERLKGTVTERLARFASSSVLVVHPVWRPRLAPLKHVLCAVDLSEHALPAVEAAAAIARRLGAFVTLAHVYDLLPPARILNEPYAGHDDHSFGVLVHDALDEVRRAELDGIPTGIEVLRDKTTVRALCDLASSHFVSDRQVDLMVVGTHGRTGVPRFFLGSVAERLISRAPCSVLVAR
jgi:nucleotide-binding universal stress UspA family protein